MNTHRLAAAGAALAAFAGLAAHAATASATFALDTAPAASKFAVDTLAHSAAFAVETCAEAGNVRRFTDVAQILPIAHWGKTTVTFTPANGGTASSLSFTADGVIAAWTPDASGTWTLSHSGNTISGSSGAATFVLSSIAFITGEGTQESPKTAEDGEALQHIVDEIVSGEGEADDYPVYVAVGEEDGEPAVISLPGETEGDDVTLEVPGGTTVAIDEEGTIVIPEGVVATLVVNGERQEVEGMASIAQNGTVRHARSEMTFALNTMPAASVFDLDTLAHSATFYVETCAEAGNVRRISSLSDVLPIAYWGKGATATVTIRHNDGATETRTFNADGTLTWTPNASGTWTLTHSPATIAGAAGSATFVLEGGSATVSSLVMTGIRSTADGLALSFAPTFAEDGADGSAWLQQSVAAKLLKVRAATSLDKLDTAEAILIDFTDLDASYDAEKGTVTFNLSLEAMKAIDPDATRMFFRVEAE